MTDHNRLPERREMLSTEQIERRIAEFPQWHYSFDLRGHRTPIFDEKNVFRHGQRRKYFMDPTVRYFGGSLEGKRVLDLGCNAGFWSLACVEAGCDFVLGIDGRQTHVDQANFVFEVKEIRDDGYRFIRGNIQEMDLRQFGQFDIVLFLGLMYHINRPVEIMEQIASVSKDFLIIDTVISGMEGSLFELRRELTEDPRNSLDYELVMVPTADAVHDLATEFGYSVGTLTPRFRNRKGENDYRGAHDYRTGRRRAFLCSKKTNVSEIPVEYEKVSVR